jgi:hypothetical protein
LQGEDVLSEVVDVLSQFVFMYKEQLLASLDALASEEADDAAALTHEVRQQGESQVLDDLMSCSGTPKFACWLRLGRAMVKVLLFLGGLAILLVSSRQVFLMFRDGSFRARGNRLIVRNAHPIIFWMNFVGLMLFGVVGVALICWQLFT